jgi:hypothetical protein
MHLKRFSGLRNRSIPEVHVPIGAPRNQKFGVRAPGNLRIQITVGERTNEIARDQAEDSDVAITSTARD